MQSCGPEYFVAIQLGDVPQVPPVLQEQSQPVVIILKHMQAKLNLFNLRL